MDFTGASLRIQPVGDKETIAALEKIDQRLKQSQDNFNTISDAEFARANANWDRITGAAEKANARAAAAAEQAADRAAKAQEVLETRMSRSTQSASRGLEIIARTGSVTGRSMDNILASISNIALGFGSSGLLVGAAAIAGSAIIDVFTKTRKELEKTQLEFNQRLDQMLNARNMRGIDEETQKLFSGDQYAAVLGKNPGESDVDFLVRSQGLQGLRRLQAQLQAKYVPQYDAKTGLALPITGELAEVNRLLAQQEDLYRRVGAAHAIAIKQVGDAAEAELRSLRDKAQLRSLLNPDVSPGAKLTDSTMTLAAARNLPIANVSGASVAERVQALELVKQMLGADAQVANTDEKRAKILREIEGILKEIDELRPPSVLGAIKGPKVDEGDASNPLSPAGFKKWAEKLNAQMNEYSDQLGRQLAGTFARSISAGLESAFAKGGGIKSAWKALTGSFLEGLGEMFETIGEKALAGLAFIKTITDAIAGMAPEIGIPAAIGLIALGAVLKGAGARAASSGSGGGSYSSYAAPANTRGTVLVHPTTPASSTVSAAGLTAKQPITVNATIIGKDDPQAQWQLLEMIARAQRRGAVSG